MVQLKRQHVEFVQAASGIQFSTVQAPETDPLGGNQSANQLDPGDWLLLNNRYTFDDMDKQVTLRFANNQAAGTLRGLVEVRTDAVDGPVIATCELRSTGGNGVYTSRPARSRARSPARTGSTWCSGRRPVVRPPDSAC